MRELRGDLDWITLKSMEKNRTRYASASELAADLSRHLADEPVSARPANFAYRSRKFVRRHRAGVAIGAAAIAVLVAFGATMAVQSSRIAAQRDLATRERERAERVSGFLVSLFEASDPDRSKGEKVTARQILDLGRQRLDSELKDQPRTRAALLHTIGAVYAALDLNDVAEPLLSQALEMRKAATGRDRADLADTMNGLARIYQARASSIAPSRWMRRSFVSGEKCLARRTSKWPTPSTTWVSTRSIAGGTTRRSNTSDRPPTWRGGSETTRTRLRYRTGSASRSVDKVGFKTPSMQCARV